MLISNCYSSPSNFSEAEGVEDSLVSNMITDVILVVIEEHLFTTFGHDESASILKAVTREVTLDILCFRSRYSRSSDLCEEGHPNTQKVVALVAQVLIRFLSLVNKNICVR